jgi:hypothetical protein
MGLIVLLIGIVTAFNLLILIAKIKARRWGDFSADILSLIVLSAVFGHTILGMLIAMTASFIISIYLLIFGI